MESNLQENRFNVVVSFHEIHRNDKREVKSVKVSVAGSTGSTA